MTGKELLAVAALAALGGWVFAAWRGITRVLEADGTLRWRRGLPWGVAFLVAYGLWCLCLRAY